MVWKKSAYLYNTVNKFPFRLSRSKIDLFLECPKCFYLDRRHGIGRPSMPGFSLNSAVDTLLKKEFDLLRVEGKPHELMSLYKIDAVPFKHPEIDTWRDSFKGQEYLHKETNLVITGAIDDIWIDSQKKLHIIDYKSTSTEKDISLEDEYKKGYKTQMEIYQWIFRRKGFDISDLGYFVFANAGKNRPKFDAKLEFELSIIPYNGNDSWVEMVLFDIKTCLDRKEIPAQSENCEYCSYRDNISETDKNGGEKFGSKRGQLSFNSEF
jgi:hypothetical protein